MTYAVVHIKRVVVVGLSFILSFLIIMSCYELLHSNNWNMKIEHLACKMSPEQAKSSQGKKMDNNGRFYRFSFKQNSVKHLPGGRDVFFIRFDRNACCLPRICAERSFFTGFRLAGSCSFGMKRYKQNLCAQ